MEELIILCEMNNINLSAEHIQEKENVEADALSRVSDWADWELNQQIFEVLQSHWGSFGMDLFASSTNKKIPSYFSWKPDPEALGLDAMTQRWEGNVYAYPPYSMILKVLQKLRMEKGCDSLTLIAPCWTGWTW
jgi:hypothetical protein